MVALGEKYFIHINGNRYTTTGTSLSATTTATMIALVNQYLTNQHRPTLGFINPLLYHSASAIFQDMIDGSTTVSCGKLTQNGGSSGQTIGYESRKGWDPVSGLGTLTYKRLLDEVIRVYGDPPAIRDDDYSAGGGGGGGEFYYGDSSSSSNPTLIPSFPPTQYPTILPTLITEFTSEPTTEPAFEPTFEPTVEPTVEPTTPTTEPTAEPTTEPSAEPTSELTTALTIAPTIAPTTMPTVVLPPTSRPSSSNLLILKALFTVEKVTQFALSSSSQDVLVDAIAAVTHVSRDAVEYLGIRSSSSASLTSSVHRQMLRLTSNNAEPTSSASSQYTLVVATRLMITLDTNQNKATITNDLIAAIQTAVYTQRLSAVLQSKARTQQVSEFFHSNITSVTFVDEIDSIPTSYKLSSGTGMSSIIFSLIIVGGMIGLMVLIYAIYQLISRTYLRPLIKEKRAKDRLSKLLLSFMDDVESSETWKLPEAIVDQSMLDVTTFEPYKRDTTREYKEGEDEGDGLGEGIVDYLFPEEDIEEQPVTTDEIDVTVTV
jgi:hypothetical protein